MKGKQSDQAPDLVHRGSIFSVSHLESRKGCKLGDLKS